MKFFATFILASSFAYASECPIKVLPTIQLPEGETRTPTSVLEILTQKGYAASFSKTGVIRGNELLAITTVDCLHTDFNPNLRTCTTSAIITNSQSEIVAMYDVQTTATSLALVIKADEAYAGLPDCSGL